jgi:hypothetical protein
MAARRGRRPAASLSVAPSMHGAARRLVPPFGGNPIKVVNRD